MAPQAIPITSDDRLRFLLGRVSHLRASASDAQLGTAQIAREVLESLNGRAVVISVRPERVSGPRLVTTITRDQELNGASALEAAKSVEQADVVRGAGSLVGGGRVIGGIDLYLVARSLRHDAVAPLARYLGEQIGGLIAFERLENETRWLAAQVASVQSEIARRKVTSRAIGILVREHRIGPAEAARQLEEHSRKMGKPVAEIAGAVVTSEKLGSLPPAPRLSRYRRYRSA